MLIKKFAPVIIIIVLIGAIGFSQINYTEMQVSNLIDSKSRYLSIYVAIIQAMSGRTQRFFELQDNWCSDFEMMFPDDTLKYVLYHNITGLRGKTLLPLTDKNLIYVYNMFILFYDAMEDFYHNTSHRWFYRSTEDCFVDVRNIGKYIDSLEKIYNPLNEFVLKGQMIDIREQAIYFVHGGSGWIMSRKAVEIALELRTKTMESTLGITTVCDDNFMQFWSHELHLNKETFYSDAFMGAPLITSSVEAVVSGRYTDLPKCTMPQNEMSLRMQRVNNVVFWHSGRADNFAVFHGNRLLREMPKNVYAEYPRSGAQLCLSRR